MISSVMDTLNLAPNLEVIKQILNELVDGNERLLSRLSNGEKVSCLVKELFSPKLDMNAFKSFRRGILFKNFCSEFDIVFTQGNQPTIEMPNKLFSLENSIKRQRKHIIKDCFSESHVTKCYEESVLPEIFEQLETIWNTNMFTKNEENNPLLKQLVFDKYISKL